MINRMKGYSCICGKESTYQQGNGRNTIYYCGDIECSIKMGESCNDYKSCWHVSQYCNGGCGIEFHHLLNNNQHLRWTNPNTDKSCNHFFCDKCIDDAECKFCSINWAKLMYGNIGVP